MTDVKLIEQTLEIAAERCEDLTPDVFACFFARCPETRQLFKVLDPERPPLAGGQMCFEVIQLVRDAAEGRSYVPDYVQHVAQSHLEIRVNHLPWYREFLAALVETMACLLGDDWRPEHAGAWARQCDVLMRSFSAQPMLVGVCPHR